MKLKRDRSIYGVVLLAALAGPVWGASTVFTAELPERVTEYTSRVDQCIDWGKQLKAGTSDPARAAIITRAIEALDCKNIDLETAYLEKKYNDHSPATEAVEAATLDWKNFQQPEGVSSKR